MVRVNVTARLFDSSRMVTAFACGRSLNGGTKGVCVRDAISPSFVSSRTLDARAA